MTHYAYNLDPLRRETALRGLSNRELGRRAGLTPATAARALRGEGVHPRTIRLLARALEVPMSELLATEPDPAHDATGEPQTTPCNRP